MYIFFFAECNQLNFFLRGVTQIHFSAVDEYISASSGNSMTAQSPLYSDPGEGDVVVRHTSSPCLVYTFSLYRLITRETCSTLPSSSSRRTSSYLVVSLDSPTQDTAATDNIYYETWSLSILHARFPRFCVSLPTDKARKEMLRSLMTEK